MSYACDRFLPADMTWRDLFDLIIVGARKPHFFLYTQPAFAVASEEGLLEPVMGKPELGRVLLGGHAGMVEEMLGLRGSQFLYVGDHAYGDVHVSKNLRRWRTALIVRELEEDLAARAAFADELGRLEALMAEKHGAEFELAQLRLKAQRARREHRAKAAAAAEKQVEAARGRLIDLDQRITPLAQAAGELSNPVWGLLMRSGNDKSFFARQVERHADIYTSRVSNLLNETPFAFFRSQSSAMPHERAQASD
jgi:5'-nucleotidase